MWHFCIKNHFAFLRKKQLHSVGKRSIIKPEVRNVDYVFTVMEKPVTVDAVISVHYYEYPIDFSYSGEVHDFWELVYADKGEAIITAGTQELCLEQGYMYLHKPMEYHNIRCNENSAVNSFIISFSSDYAELYRLAGKPIAIDSRMRALMAELVVEAKDAFSSPLGEVVVPQLIRNENAAFGSEQMIQIHLEELLVRLLRAENAAEAPQRTPNQRRGDALLKSVCAYLEENIAGSTTMEELCSVFTVSKSTLQKLFQNRVGYGVSRYYQQLKIDRAKSMIREKKYNFTEIAQKLGYSSVHYFSRHFKRITEMTPSEYADSLQAMSDGQVEDAIR